MSMAEKRMFAKSVIDSDNFLDMPLTTQALYFHLGMRADDDGFVDCPRKIQRSIGCSDDDLKLLIAKGFAIAFNSGIIVIRHWKLHNYIPKDRYKETIYLKEKAQLTTDENRVYSDPHEAVQAVLYTDCIQTVDKVDTQIRTEKIRANEEYIYPAKSGGFEAVWAIYPRKKDKAAARKAYEARLHDGWSPDELLSAVKAYAAECRKERRDEKYIKHGSTFFGASTPFSDYIPKHDAQFVDDLNGVI